MPEDMIQQAAPGGFAGIVAATTTMLAANRFFSLWAKPEHVALVRLELQAEIAELKGTLIQTKLECDKRDAELKAEIAEKYMSKEALEPFLEDIRHIRERVDQIVDKRIVQP